MSNVMSPKDLEYIKNGNVPSTHYQDNIEYQPSGTKGFDYMKNYHFHKCIYEGKLRKEPLKQEKWDPLMIGYSVIALLAVVLVIIVAIIF